MRALVEPVELARVAGVLASASREIDDLSRRVRPGTTMSVAAAVGLRSVIGGAGSTVGGGGVGLGSGVPGIPGAAAAAAAGVVVRVERDVLATLAECAREGALLDGLAAGLRRAAQWYAMAEDAVGAALTGLNRLVHDHPDRLEALAATGHRHALEPLLTAAEGRGLLSERNDRVVSLQTSPPREGAVPTGLGDLVGDAVEVGDEDGRVRVTEIIRSDGTSVWVVGISGTQKWDLAVGENPFDATADVRAIRREVTSAALGVHLALLTAQRSTGRDTSAEPVLLTGHSLGGLLAGGLASDATFRHGRNVTGVVTAGAPIGRLPVPATVGVVAIEHRQDPVPRLDGVVARQSDTWTTHVVDLDRMVTGGLGSRAHSGELHTETAARIEAQANATEGTEAWEEVIAPFVGSEGRAVVHDVVLTRQWQNPRS